MYSKHLPPYDAPRDFACADSTPGLSKVFSVRSFGTISLLLAISASAPSVLHGAGLAPSTQSSADYFGYSLGAFGSSALVGAYGDNQRGEDAGAAYLFLIPPTVTGMRIPTAKATASDGVTGDIFGISASTSASIGLIGAIGDDSYRGSAYLFLDLDTATGQITQDAKLTASDGQASDIFGCSTSLYGSMGLIGAYGDDNYRGSAYVFRELPVKSGAITQNLKLTASDGASFDFFGQVVSLSGTIGLVGAEGDDSSKGSAYVFHSLDTATGTITQTAKLTASDGQAQHFFGGAVSISGGTGLVGARGATDSRGAAYLFRGLLGASGDVEESAKLVASDPAISDLFGKSVSVSGTSALVGAPGDDVDASGSGSVYLFRNLDTASGTVTEAVRVSASDGALADSFGGAVSLDGDFFIVGAPDKNFNKGKAYSGSIDSVTTLDTGNVQKPIDGIDFVSRRDWIIGQTTDGNSVTLEKGSAAAVTAIGKKVYIGKNAGSDNNTLNIGGTLTASEVRVGATGNTGNTLILDTDGLIPTGCNVFVASGSSIGGSGLLQGNLSLSAGAQLEFAPTYGLKVSGTCTLTPTFGVDDLIGLSSTVASGTYYLIKNSTTSFSTIGLENFGKAQAKTIGGGKAAYLGAPATGMLTLIVYNVPAPVITSVTTVKGKVDSVLSYRITASNFPTRYSATGLPPGLRIDAATGRITGKPTKDGTFNTTVGASNSTGAGSKVVQFTIAKETTKPVLTIGAPLSLSATTQNISYTIKGAATDNISPVAVVYRINPPGTTGFGNYKSITLAGTTKSKSWSYALSTKVKGEWVVEFRAADAAGNVSTAQTVRITRK